MSEGQDAERARVDALASRMLGGLLVCGAAVLLSFCFLLMGLPRIGVEGHVVLVLPGTQGRHGLSAVALPVLGAGGLLLGVPGVIMLARPGQIAGPHESKPRRVRRPVLVLLAGLAVLGIALLRHR